MVERRLLAVVISLCTLGCGYSEKDWQAQKAAQAATQAELDKARERVKQLETQLQQADSQKQQLTLSLEQCKNPPPGDTGASPCATIEGDIDSSSHWGSAWMDLRRSTTFEKGTRLRLTLADRRAGRVVVRLLPAGASPERPVGALGIFDVPQNRIVEVALGEAHPSVEQISVHGSPRAWHYVLGPGNGPAKLEAIARCR